MESSSIPSRNGNLGSGSNSGGHKTNYCSNKTNITMEGQYNTTDAWTNKNRNGMNNRMGNAVPDQDTNHRVLSSQEMYRKVLAINMSHRDIMMMAESGLQLQARQHRVNNSPSYRMPQLSKQSRLSESEGSRMSVLQQQPSPPIPPFMQARRQQEQLVQLSRHQQVPHPTQMCQQGLHPTQGPLIPSRTRRLVSRDMLWEMDHKFDNEILKRDVIVSTTSSRDTSEEGEYGLGPPTKKRFSRASAA